ncbi:MAG TPA: hypothetical protein VFE35_01605 [Candidatus Cybelea sp.]|nr:hypothetical protein [Candidatus Cybelea sp.]
MHPSTRMPTILLAVGAAVLLIAVAIGERMGDRVIGQATEQALQSVGPISLSASPNGSPQPYGPDWKRSQALSAAGDPRFPDPRVPPQPLPTPLPTPKPRPTPKPTPTPNPNIPIWRQKPLPTVTPSEVPAAEGSAVPSAPAAQGSTAPNATTPPNRLLL